MGSQYDGPINIDTKIDTDGFNKGMKDAAKSATKTLDAIARGQARWSKMTWGAQEKAILKTIALYGDLWNAMDFKAQRDAIREVVGTIQEVTGATQELTGTDFDKIGSGLGKIMSALVPSTYRIRRATKGMNELAKASSKNLFVLFASVAAISAVITILALGFIALGKAAWNWAERTTQSLYRSLSTSSEMRQEVEALQSGFEAVKGSIMAMGATLLNAIAPILLKVIGWLIQMINFVSMFIASLMGQKKVLQYVSGEADEAKKATGGMADNMERTKGAAEGALAAFDQLNVLPQAQAAGGGGGIGGGLTEMELVDVPIDFAKNKWLEFLAWWDTVVKPAFADAWKNLWPNLSENIRTAMKKIWAVVKKALVSSWQLFVIFWALIYLAVRNKINQMKTAILDLASYLRTKLVTMKANFLLGWSNIKEAFLEQFEGMKDGFKLIMNSIIGFLNSMIAGIVSGVNVAIRALNTLSVSFPDWMPGGLGGKSFGVSLSEITAPKIPLLASGAVIPPNAPFAAVLGEQRSGTNIEAPENLIRQIIREEMTDRESTVNINFGGSMGAVVRAMKPFIDKENTRTGESLVQRSMP